MEKFKRRTYRNLREVLTDVKVMTSKRKEIKGLMRDGVIDEAFRERLMLAVTEVNGCRYCLHAHARMALTAGISEKELQALGRGLFDSSPKEEVIALLYAQHWAETNAKPEIEARERVVAQYGKATVEAIELVLRMIRMGNLLGNTWDYFLYRMSFGHWGGEE